MGRMGFWSASDYHAAWSPNGKWLAIAAGKTIGNYEGEAQVHLWGAGQDGRLLSIAPDYWPDGLSWSPDSSILAVGLIGPAREPSVERQAEIVLWEPASGREIDRLAGQSNPWFAPDGARLVATGVGAGHVDLRILSVGAALKNRAFLPWCGRQ